MAKVVKKVTRKPPTVTLSAKAPKKRAPKKKVKKKAPVYPRPDFDRKPSYGSALGQSKLRKYMTTKEFQDDFWEVAEALITSVRTTSLCATYTKNVATFKRILGITEFKDAASHKLTDEMIVKIVPFVTKLAINILEGVVSVDELVGNSSNPTMHSLYTNANISRFIANVLAHREDNKNFADCDVISAGSLELTITIPQGDVPADVPREHDIKKKLLVTVTDDTGAVVMGPVPVGKEASYWQFGDPLVDDD